VTAGRPVIDWYPGHIAKAERLMSEVLSMVDVVVELRDARIPVSTAHPMLQTWIGSRGHVLALNRRDAAPDVCLAEWSAAIGLASGPAPVLVDAKKGAGIDELRQAILEQGR
jgi:ribosome biogenesis GTPase A